MRRRIVIVHHPRSFFALDLRRAIGSDLEPIWVLVGETDRALPRLLARTGPVIDAAGLDAPEIARRLVEHRPQGIVTFVDDTVPLTAAIAARLGLPYHTEEVAATVVDKQRQRRAFAAAGVPGPGFWMIPAGIATDVLAALADEIVYPAVLKPSSGSGSLGLRRIACAAELLEQWDRSQAAIVEEYLEDTEDRDRRFASYLSVESVVCDGHISHAAICGRFPLAAPFRETGNFIPAAVPAGLEDELLDLAERAIRALSITTAVLHTEIKLTDSGPRLIEINGRLGGRPPFVLRSVSDVNLFRAACDLALGETVVLDGLAPTRGVGFWWMAQPPQDAREVLAIRGLEVIRELPEVESVSLDRRPGDAVDWREGTSGQVVTVHGRVADLDALAATIEAIAETLQIDYRRGVADPADPADPAPAAVAPH